MTNGTLSVLRRILDITVDSGARYDNLAKDKDVKRARVRRKELQLPEPDQFLALLDNLPSEGGNRVMVGVMIGRQIAHRHIGISGSFDLS